MARDIAPRPPPGSIETSLAGRPRAEHAWVKVSAHAVAFASLPLAARRGFVQDGLTVQILSPLQDVVNRAGVVIGLRVQARARDGHGPLPSGDGWHQVINPPVKVPDGTVRVEADPDTGELRDVQNFREDPGAALRAWLVESIKFDARQHGWVES